MAENEVPRVVIVGGGFAGIAAAKALRKAPVRVTLVDKTNHFLFQPLLYQVATAMLAPGDIAKPIREILRNQQNATVGLAEVTGVDVAKKHVLIDYLGRADTPYPYDYLVLATGASHSYFGHEEFAPYAPGMKSLGDATAVRNRLLGAFEIAEIVRHPSDCGDLLTFVLVGGGPTGVEMAGALAELRRFTLKSRFRRIDPTTARIILVEGSPRLLSSYPESLSTAARRRLEELGVEVRTGVHVEHVDDESVMVAGERIACRTVVWTAGVKPSPAGRWLGVETDKAGRVKVEPDCGVPGLPEVFVVGDTASFEEDGHPLAGVAQVAMQQGDYVGRLIRARVEGGPTPPPFKYFDKGNLAVIGRFFAVLSARGIDLSGLPAWFVWALVHIGFLPAPGNRIRVVTQWAWSFLTRQRSSQILLGSHRPPATTLSSNAAVEQRNDAPDAHAKLPVG